MVVFTVFPNCFACKVTTISLKNKNKKKKIFFFVKKQFLQTPIRTNPLGYYESTCVLDFSIRSEIIPSNSA